VIGRSVNTEDEDWGFWLPRVGRLPASALAMLAPGPAARSAHAFLQFLLGPADAALPGLLLLGILDPADELVTRQRRDVFPGSESRGVPDQCRAEVCRQFVHHPTGDSLAVHGVTVTGRRRSFRGDALTIQFVRVSCIAQCLGWSGPVLRETGSSRSPGTSRSSPRSSPSATLRS